MTCFQICMASASNYSEALATTSRQTNKNEIQHDLDIHLNTYSVSETIQSMCFYSLPIKVRLRAHMHFQSGVPPTIDDAMVLKTISSGL